MLDKILGWVLKKKMLSIQEFAQANRSYLVMVCDPLDDTVFMSYQGKQVAGRLRSEDGKHGEVLKGVLKHSTFEKEIDRFLGGIINLLQLSVMKGNQFYQFIDGALFNIARAAQKKKGKKS